MTTEKKRPDWERIELDYRAGLLTLREMADAHGLSNVSIHKRAKKEGWVRDLGAKIKAKADELVSKQEASKIASKEELANERQLVDASATVIFNVKMSQRTRIQRHLVLLDGMQAELEGSSEDLAARVDISKKMSDTLKTLITLERDAFNIITETKVDHTNSDGSMAGTPTRIEIVAPSMQGADEK